MAKKAKLKKRYDLENGNCEECHALCCSYIMIEIDQPEDKEDYDNIRWYVAHKDISVVYDEGDWMLYIKNKCRYIDKNHRCKIYDKRPQVCRQYDHKDCDFVADDHFDHHFKTIKDVEEYVNELFPPKKKKVAKKTTTKKKAAKKSSCSTCKTKCGSKKKSTKKSKTKK